MPENLDGMLDESKKGYSMKKENSEELYIEPTVEVSGTVVDPLSANPQQPSITICGCCFC